MRGFFQLFHGIKPAAPLMGLGVILCIVSIAFLTTARAEDPGLPYGRWIPFTEGISKSLLRTVHEGKQPPEKKELLESRILSMHEELASGVSILVRRIGTGEETYRIEFERGDKSLSEKELDGFGIPSVENMNQFLGAYSGGTCSEAAVYTRVDLYDDLAGSLAGACLKGLYAGAGQPLVDLAERLLRDLGELMERGGEVVLGNPPKEKPSPFHGETSFVDPDFKNRVQSKLYTRRVEEEKEASAGVLLDTGLGFTLLPDIDFASQPGSGHEEELKAWEEEKRRSLMNGTEIDYKKLPGFPKGDITYQDRKRGMDLFAAIIVAAKELDISPKETASFGCEMLGTFADVIYSGGTSAPLFLAKIAKGEKYGKLITRVLRLMAGVEKGEQIARTLKLETRLLRIGEKYGEVATPGKLKGFSEALENSGETGRFVFSKNLVEGDLGYSSALRNPLSKKSPAILSLGEVPNLMIKESDLILVSEVRNGTTGLVKMAELPDGSAVAVKTIITPNKALEEMLALEDVQSLQLMNDLGFGPHLRGITKDSKGRIGIVMDVVPGDFKGKVATQTLQDLDVVLGRLKETGVGRLDDFQYFITPESRMIPIDGSTLKETLGTAFDPSSYARQRLALLKKADSKTAAEYLGKLKIEHPSDYDELLKLDPGLLK